MKLSPNTPCPCHSGEKYKKCCQPYHKGIFPSNALKLMRSRYCAYSLGLSEYIIHTTHCDNVDFTVDIILWRANIDTFTHSTTFDGLKIVEFIDGSDSAFVTFEAMLNGTSFREKSRFFKVNGKWLYERGEFS